MLRRLTLTLLLALPFLAWVLWQKPGSEPRSQAEITLDQSYQWQAFGSQLWHNQADPTETTQTVLYAERITYRDTDQQSRMRKPISLQQSDQSLRLIQSLQGQTFDDNRLTLTGDVRLAQFRPGSDQAWSKWRQLETETLHYLPSQQRLHSPVTTHLYTPQSLARAEWFEADLQTELLHLHDQVFTHHWPQPDQVPDAHRDRFPSPSSGAPHL
ncbi:LPS export ABC transporter periplasmic protein LptC [Hydrogenovibrio halophilus]|uniref:LPS export ABC transporter periplasmic protein LptC n=1 Tax=Hydrogenovibrio halophilus TaxID=373391 RepID=UPI00036D1FAC|nr:LPS export ABC transporter periplasmic protein LptC [Hydrogenovibrio halophilus]